VTGKTLGLEGDQVKDPAMPLARIAVIALLALAGPVLGQTAGETPSAEAPVSRLGDALQLDALFEVLRDEGLANGAELQADMFPGGGGLAWESSVAGLYDLPALRARFDTALGAALDDEPEIMAEITAFFASDLGRRIVGLEIEARRAFLDTAAEEAARVAADRRRMGREARAEQIDRFIATGDLLEMNVAGALTGNLAFLSGMNETGINGVIVPQQELMAQVWDQEEQIRSDTESWLHAYLGLAYAPLTDAELDAYIAFWETPAGQRLNAALFGAFDAAFGDVSLELGRAAGRAMLGRDI
jgi:hypothetical protein